MGFKLKLRFTVEIKQKGYFKQMIFFMKSKNVTKLGRLDRERYRTTIKLISGFKLIMNANER